jgi:methyl-accepting chemotaxis protein
MSLEKIRIVHKGLLAIAAVAAAALLAAGIGIAALQEKQQEYTELLQREVAQAIALQRANRSLAVFGMETYRGILAAQDAEGRRTSAAGREQAEQTFFQRLREAEAAAPQEAARLAGFAERFRGLVALAGQALALAERDQEAARRAMRETYLPAYQGLSEEVQRYVAGRIEAVFRRSSELGAAAAAAQAKMLAIVGLGLVLAAGLAVWLLLFGVARPMARLASATRALADGRLDTAVPGTDRGDEVGQLAQAVQVLRDNSRRARALEEEAKAAEARAVAERRRELNDLAARFEASVGRVTQTVAAAGEQLAAHAATLSAVAERTGERAGRVAAASGQTNTNVRTVAAASGQTNTNVRTVAAAAEELSASIAEITRQVAGAAEVARRAVAEVRESDRTMQGLAENAKRIGDVVKLISDIAGQTNLLALNATIEAARAGEAGKGFAVVASEVKTLAAQTAKATEEIAAQATAIQGETERAVAAIRGISSVIEEIDRIAAAIAAAVEEQGAATREIARNVQEAAQGTGEVTRSIADVSAAAAETTAAVAELRRTAGEVADSGRNLQAEASRFLGALRAA